jgi:hypothetical protein
VVPCAPGLVGVGGSRNRGVQVLRSPQHARLVRILRWRDAEVFADLAGQNVRDLRVAGDGDSGAIAGIVPNRVVAAFALKRAPVAPHALFEIAALHSSSGVWFRFTAIMLLPKGSALYLRPRSR